jgi:hypothetical protein
MTPNPMNDRIGRELLDGSDRSTNSAEIGAGSTWMAGVGTGGAGSCVAVGTPEGGTTAWAGAADRAACEALGLARAPGGARKASKNKATTADFTRSPKNSAKVSRCKNVHDPTQSFRVGTAHFRVATLPGNLGL